jgi:Domain of unknown function (DUF4439)
MTAYTANKCRDCASGSLARVRSTVTRRRFLAAGATVLGAAVVAGCSPGSPGTVFTADRTDPAGPSPDPDVVLLDAAVADMTGLLATVRATIQAHRVLAAHLRPLTLVVRQQLTVLGSADPDAQLRPATRPPVGRIPHDGERALKSLRHQTWKAMFARLDDALAAESGPFARVLSAISAGLSEQVVRLGGPARLAATPPASTVGPHEARRLQPALAAEHAAIYAYGVIGARGDEQQAATARLGYNVHLGRRQELTSMIQASGIEPLAALPAYRLPHRISGRTAVARLARRVELRCCEVYGHAVSETTAEARGFCAAAMTSCGSWSVAWGQPPQPFPGAPEL